MKDRILQLLEEKAMTLAAFADEIGVERSTMSHIKSGRSNPSLDVALKILERFPEVSTDWLILGKGSMFGQITNPYEPTLFDQTQPTASYTAEYAQKQAPETASQPTSLQNEPSTQRSIVRVILFYDDNTFEQIDKK
ncbi:MAG: helix-turn-helix transcriptional regulator [Paludibacteraceae bacterium]|nr:helix-turn-helix domain-containing protein [Bacteroidales bacterium]MDD6641102.1 helix-turn-helix transcriptional regulator [Bacteroidales bacterium]MDY4512874.1 helix-turn-helix transcriptional regulator [Paludibacteraceae bacterium]MDY4849854.1 helix-turn-helix transcriptional regulator [Paludibacteraceae bacterium]